MSTIKRILKFFMIFMILKRAHSRVAKQEEDGRWTMNFHDGEGEQTKSIDQWAQTQHFTSGNTVTVTTDSEIYEKLTSDAKEYICGIEARSRGGVGRIYGKWTEQERKDEGQRRRRPLSRFEAAKGEVAREDTEGAATRRRRRRRAL